MHISKLFIIALDLCKDIIFVGRGQMNKEVEKMHFLSPRRGLGRSSMLVLLICLFASVMSVGMQGTFAAEGESMSASVFSLQTEKDIIQVGSFTDISVQVPETVNPQEFRLDLLYDHSRLEVKSVNLSQSMKNVNTQFNYSVQPGMILMHGSGLAANTGAAAANLVVIRVRAKDCLGRVSLTLQGTLTQTDASGNSEEVAGNASKTINIADVDVDGGGLTISDISLIAKSQGKTVGNPGYEERLDMDGNGMVGAEDIQYAANQLRHPQSFTYQSNTNIFGIGLLIGPADDAGWQLDRARELTGNGGYAVQDFDLMKYYQSPSNQMIQFLKGCYDRGLIPVIRFTGENAGWYWKKPAETARNDYSALAGAARRVLSRIPMKAGVPVYVELFTEPNTRHGWGNEQPNAEEYGYALYDIGQAIHSLQDSRLKVMNGGLRPGGDYLHLSYLENMLEKVPEALQVIDVWAAHVYPGNCPPTYNLHNNTAAVRTQAIDSYVDELQLLKEYGRKDVNVMITHAGYSINDASNSSFPAVTEELRTAYVRSAYETYWSSWPEIIGICSSLLMNTSGLNIPGIDWSGLQWMDVQSGSEKPVFTEIKGLPKLDAFMDPYTQGTMDKNMDIQLKNNLGISAVATVSSSIDNDWWGNGYGWDWHRRYINDGYTARTILFGWLSAIGWHSAGETAPEAPHWVQYQFQQPSTIEKAVLYPRCDEGDAGKYFPQEFEFQVSEDGVHWRMVKRVEYDPAEIFNPGRTPQTYYFEPVTTRYLRLFVTRSTNGGDGGYHVALTEMEVY